MKFILLLVVLALLFFYWRSRASAAARPVIGQWAPAFNLLDTHKVAHTLADYRGHWLVLYFYPKADTPHCTQQACRFRDGWPELQAMDVRLIGISADAPTVNAAFARKFHLPFPLLSDSDGAFARQYGAWMNLGITGLARRHTYLIDPDGRIAQAYTDISVAGHSADVLADLRRLTGH